MCMYCMRSATAVLWPAGQTIKKQLKWVQEVWACPISWHSPWKYAEIACTVQRCLAFFVIIELKSLQSLVIGRVRLPISKM